MPNKKDETVYLTDLVNMVTDVLIKCGHTRPEDWKRGLHPDAINNSDMHAQRFLINRHWRVILGEIPESFDARFCLVDTGDLDDWLRLFETGVVPCILKHNLPRPLH